MLRDGDRYPGTMRLGDGNLYFRSVPVGPKKRPVAWELPVTVIDRTEFQPPTFTLHVGSMSHRFEGADLEHLHHLLAPSDAQPVARGAAQEGPLLEGSIHLYRNRLLATRGEISLTPKRLRFKPTSGLDSMLLGELNVDVDVDDINGLTMSKVQRQLEIRVESRDYRFTGALAPRVYGILVALRGDTVTLRPNEVVFSWPASFCRGPVELEGQLTATRRRIRFEPTGRIDALFRVDEEIAIKLVDITRAELRGRVDTRLVVHSGSKEYAFAVTDADERFAAIRELLIEVYHESEPLLPPDGARARTPEIDAFLKPWFRRIPKLETPPLNLMGQVLDKSHANRLRRGWLCVVGPIVAFLPAGGPKGKERPLVIPLVRVSRGEQGTAPPEHLHFGVQGTTLRFEPQSGDSIVDTFWALWQQQVNLVPVAERKKPWSGPTEDDPLNRRDAYRAEMPPGWPVSIRAATEADFATVSDTEAPVLGLDDDTLEAIPTLGHEDDDPTSAAAKTTLEGTLMDLSPEGCALRLDQEYTDDPSVILILAGERGEVEIAGRLIYSFKSRTGRWRHGIAFESLSTASDEAVRDLYMSLQRHEVATEKAKWYRQSEGTEASEEHAVKGPTPSGGLLDSSN